MHIKIQGGGDGKYANTGSCSSLVSYLEHEDLDRIKQDQKIEPFFSHTENALSGNAIIEAIDNNKQKLCKGDSKFFMITVSPSQNELAHLGKTPEEQSEKLKEFVRHEVMQKYAENFKKELNAKDLMYYGKIHHERKTNIEDGNLHIHILVSRKSADGRLKLSPMTNHQNTKKGAVKGGFSRIDYYSCVERAFDEKHLYQRKREEQFDYKKQFKKADVNKIQGLTKDKYEYNHQQKEGKEQFIKDCKGQGFSDKDMDSMFKGKAIEKEDNSFSIKLTDNVFELVSIANSFGKILQHVGGDGQSADDNPRNKKRRSI